MRHPDHSIHPPPRLSAFTLIELLTVIAIIGILAAITIPTVGRVRDQARIAQCQSNLRQVHLAIMMYVNEHRDMMPGPLTSAMTPYFKLNNKGEPTKNQLAGQLAPYMGITMPKNSGDEAYNHYLRCPAQLATMSPSERLSSTAPRSYSVSTNTNDGRPFGYDGDKEEAKNYYTWLSGRNPRKAWLLRDDDQVLHLDNDSFTKTPSHKKGRNYVYADGSVRFLTPQLERAQSQLPD